VKSFYEKAPFPPYDDHESLRSLIEKSRRNRYHDAINRALPFNSSILDVGCGTGQLTNVLGVSCRRVIGADISSSSLALAERFRREHRLSRVRFVQMNLFKPCFKPAQFDVVVCNGVLHHTGDPRGGFERLLPLVKPGGYIVVGLYNRYGRMMNNLRRQFRTAEQYRPPHESTHTIDEVLAWFERASLQFVRGIPSTTGEGDFDGGLLTPSRPGTPLDHAQVQLKQIVAGNRDGGLFVMIGRVPATKAGSIPVRRTSEMRAHAV
jgi:2-polyprenyl-3-methyl-5-hydroxy-6-metoxy-1,4-benzoquinol methylase